MKGYRAGKKLQNI